MAEEIEPCRCVEVGIHVARNLDDALRLMRVGEPGRSLIHSDFVLEQLPKIEECLLIDLASVKESLEKVREYIETPDEAKKWLDRAYTRFHRAIRECHK